ncbi:MAG: tetratricopeptide repeat protein, partial [Deltaproteobacteria bacterium]|nr:tetratricopeptide repeat protein [Deltaproteobacteria bacterium]
GAKGEYIHYNLAFAYDQIGKRKEAISEYEKFALHKPAMEVLTILANYYMEEKQYDSAISTYEKMIKISPHAAGLYSGIGYACSLKGDTDRAIANYKASIRYDSEDDVVYCLLGNAYEKKGMYNEALREYTNAYQVNPDSNEAARKILDIKIRMLQKKHQ